jgi:hypothetical protein
VGKQLRAADVISNTRVKDERRATFRDRVVSQLGLGLVHTGGNEPDGVESDVEVQIRLASCITQLDAATRPCWEAELTQVLCEAC